MNFEYYQKVLLLPLKCTEKGVLRTLAYHCNKSQNNLCIPSWDTLIAESGVSRGILNKILTVACDAGIIEKKSRADIGKGKKPNEYFFLFEDISFYGRGGQIKLSKANREKFKLRIEEARKRFKESELQKNKPSISSDMNYPINASSSTYHKPQKFRNELSDTAGLRGHTISTTGEPISTGTSTISKGDFVCSSHFSADSSNCDSAKNVKRFRQESGVNLQQDSTDVALVERKTVWQEKGMNTLQENNIVEGQPHDALQEKKEVKPKMRRIIA